MIILDDLAFHCEVPSSAFHVKVEYRKRWGWDSMRQAVSSRSTSLGPEPNMNSVSGIMRRLLHPRVLVVRSYFTYQNITNLTSTSPKGQQIDIYERPWQLVIRQQVPVCGSSVIVWFLVDR